MTHVNQSDIFSGVRGERRGVDAGPGVGYVVTNHLNVMYMIGMGLVLPRVGFRDKHYQDSISCLPGWIPVFTRKPPKAVIEHSIAEARYLLPCIVRISLKGLSGPVLVKADDAEEIVPRGFPENIGREDLLFVPGPLPTSSVEAILFRSADDRKKFMADTADYSNVSVKGFAVRTDKRLFSAMAGEQWPPAWVGSRAPEGATAGENALQWGQALGGTMGMLRLMASKVLTCGLGAGGEETLGVTCLRLACDPGTVAGQDLEGSILAGLAEWAQVADHAQQFGGRITDLERNDTWRGLFWRVIGRMVAAQAAEGSDVAQASIEYLSGAAKELGGALGKRVGGLCDDLVSLGGLPKHTASELLRAYATPLPRAMILLLLRGSGAELLDFVDPELNEDDWLAASVLFGVRSGWRGLPVEMRGGAETGRAVSHRMAALCHRVAATGFVVGEPPKRPTALVEAYLGDWEDGTEREALEVARKWKWDCVWTRVRLGRGSYDLTVGPGGVEIEFQGEPRNVRPFVERHEFLRCLAQHARDLKVEEHVAKVVSSTRRA